MRLINWTQDGILPVGSGSRHQEIKLDNLPDQFRTVILLRPEKQEVGRSKPPREASPPTCRTETDHLKDSEWRATHDVHTAASLLIINTSFVVV